jgi:hypothetical protein
MKNKLLLSTALIGSIAFAAPLMAETKITGSIDMSYAGSSVDANAGAASADGLGSETQLNISNSGDLNVGGLKYKAGFSIESDNSVDAFENAYINISNSSGTTFTVGSDHFPALDGTVTPVVSIAADTVSGNNTGANNETIGGLYYFNGSRIDAVESQGLGILQTVGKAGTVGIYYAPTLGNSGQTTGNDSIPANTANSATNIQFKGSLGVDGLTVLAGQEKSDGATTANSDRKATNYGVSYNFGQVAVGASRVKNELSAGNEIESDEVGVTFAINDNFTVGAMYVESDNSTAATADEEITMLSAGYNLGGLVTSVTYSQVENIAGGATDTEFFNVRIGAKF